MYLGFLCIEAFVFLVLFLFLFFFAIEFFIYFCLANIFSLSLCCLSILLIVSFLFIHSVDGFFCSAEAFQFYVILLVSFCFCFLYF